MSNKIIVLTPEHGIEINSKEKEIKSSYIKVHLVVLTLNNEKVYGRTVRLYNVMVNRHIHTYSKREESMIPLVIKVSTETDVGKMFMKLNDSYMKQINNYLESGTIKPKNNSRDAKNIKSMVYMPPEGTEGVVDFFPVFGKTGNQAWSNTKFNIFAKVNGKNTDKPFKEEITEENFHEYFYKGMTIPIMDVNFSQVVSSSKGFKCTINIRKIIANYEKKEDTMEIPDDIFNQHYVEPEKEPEPESEPESKEADFEEPGFEDVEGALSRLNMEMNK